MILANDDRPRTTHDQAERAARHLLPDAVGDLLDQNDARRAARRAVWRNTRPPRGPSGRLRAHGRSSIPRRRTQRRSRRRTRALTRAPPQAPHPGEQARFGLVRGRDVKGGQRVDRTKVEPPYEPHYYGPDDYPQEFDGFRALIDWGYADAEQTEPIKCDRVLLGHLARMVIDGEVLMLGVQPQKRERHEAHPDWEVDPVRPLDPQIQATGPPVCGCPSFCRSERFM